MSKYVSDFAVKFARLALVKMRGGSPVCEPAHFDRMMAVSGLAPEDIDATADEIEAAKRRFRVAWARKGLIAVAAGHSAYEPVHFDRMMAEFGLTPEDIGSSKEEVEAAKQYWRVKLAKQVLTAVAAGHSAYEPVHFDRMG